jgi:hypothetical protein
MSALEYKPCNGHCWNNRFRATVSTVGVLVISFSVIKAKMIKRPPDATKRMSERTYVRKTLSRAILAAVGAIEKMELCIRNK